MTSVRAVEQTRMGIAALLVSNIGRGVLPLYWHALSGMNAISVLAYRLIATLVVMIALLMAFRRYRAYHAIAALWCAAEQKAVRAGTRRHHGYQRELVAVHISGEYLTRWGPGLLRLGAIMSFGGYCVSRPGLLRLGAVVG